MTRYPDLALFMPSLRGGGAERVMLNLGQGFVANGMEVDLVLASKSGSYVNDVPEGINVIDLGVTRVVKTLPGLTKYLRQHRPGALLSAMGHCNLAAIAAKRLAGVDTRLFLSEHNVELEPDVGIWRWLNLPLQVLTSKTYPTADAIIAVSSSVADAVADYSRMPRDQIKVIYNPVVMPQLFDQIKQPVDHPWFAPGEPPVVINVGRLTEQKDQATLLRAFALLLKQRPARLLILGEGELRDDLEKLVDELGIAEHVGLPGFVDNPFAYMANAALFALSSAWEGLPTVLIEAIACGCPVVSTDCPGGSSEILEDGKWGKLVPVADPSALSEAMLETLDMPRPNYPADAYERFTFESVVSDYHTMMRANA